MSTAAHVRTRTGRHGERAHRTDPVTHRGRRGSAGRCGRLGPSGQGVGGEGEQVPPSPSRQKRGEGAAHPEEGSRSPPLVARRGYSAGGAWRARRRTPPAALAGAFCTVGRGAAALSTPARTGTKAGAPRGCVLCCRTAGRSERRVAAGRCRPSAKPPPRGRATPPPAAAGARRAPAPPAIVGRGGGGARGPRPPARPAADPGAGAPPTGPLATWPAWRAALGYRAARADGATWARSVGNDALAPRRGWRSGLPPPVAPRLAAPARLPRAPAARAPHGGGEAANVHGAHAAGGGEPRARLLSPCAGRCVWPQRAWPAGQRRRREQPPAGDRRRLVRRGARLLPCLSLGQRFRWMPSHRHNPAVVGADGARRGSLRLTAGVRRGRRAPTALGQAPGRRAQAATAARVHAGVPLSAVSVGHHRCGAPQRSRRREAAARGPASPSRAP